MNEDLFRREFRTVPEPPKHDNLFVWTVVIILLIGLALACWLGSYYLFGHPEKPESYRFLQKIHKIEPPKRFMLTQAPAGEFLTPQKAFERYGSLSRYDLDRKNEELLRDYIKNYQSTKNLVPYITGRYSIMSSYELKPSDFFGIGLVALAQAEENPQVILEHIYPATPQTLPALEQMLRTGLDIKLEKSLDLSALIHVNRTPDGRLQLTVVPILYGTYALKQGSGSFSLEPPAQLNPEAGLPVIHGQLYGDALKTYADYTRRRSGAPALPGSTPAIPVAQTVEPTTAAQTTIVRVDTTPEPTPAPVAVATPTPAPVKPTPTPLVAQATPSPTPSATPAPVVVKPMETPKPTPAVAVATPSPKPSATPVAVAAKVPLQPFLVSAPTPTPGVATTSGSWHTYAPGKMPRGRLVSLSDASELADRGTGGERLYLRGSFVVSRSSDNRAVLRPSSSLGSALASMAGSSKPPRVIVEFPNGESAPSESATFTRDETRPFEITSVRREANGQINIFAREVTKE